MQTALFRINSEALRTDIANEALSFRPYIAYLKKLVRKEKTIKAKFYEFILEQFDGALQSKANIPVKEVAQFENLLELIYATLAPVAISEDDYLWAVSTPIPNEVFYCTGAFHKFIAGGSNGGTRGAFTQNATAFLKRQKGYLYRLILKRFYKFDTTWGTDVYYTYKNPQSGLSQYYRIHADTSFIDISIKGKLPELTFAEIEKHMQHENGIERMADILPLSMFTFTGFSVITLEDVTFRHAIDDIRNAIIDHGDNEQNVYKRVIHALKTIIGDHRIEFGLLPFVKLNGKLVFDRLMCEQSILMQSANQFGLAEEAFSTMISAYEKSPKTVFYSSIDEVKQQEHVFLKALKQAGISSYALIPVFYNKHLAGTLEVYSRQQGALYESVLSKLEFTIPLLAQLLQHSIDTFHIAINKIIRDKFTSLQSSVQWKFNEVAWRYLVASRNDEARQEVEIICFKNVYPFYGAIDIRNSTIERNRALQLDLTYVLTLLLNTLTSLKNEFNVQLPDDLVINAKTWLDRVEEAVTTSDEIGVDQFLKNEAGLFLGHYTAQNPQAQEVAADFLNYVNKKGAVAANKHRSELEKSIQQINGALNSYLGKARRELQKSYPCYFEKFRTDGIEYDMYVGQSIAPMEPFTQDSLNAVRLWQLRSMVHVARLTHDMMADLPKPLQTTQLIYIHSQPIDISFRNDERRFDVEGAYNVRYEVIKKRIDKVELKDGERLTQPGKIALVYFNTDEAETYVQHIQQLQQEGFLTNDLEHLELEELQGVTGLMAMRVGVNFNY